MPYSRQDLGEKQKELESILGVQIDKFHPAIEGDEPLEQKPSHPATKKHAHQSNENEDLEDLEEDEEGDDQEVGDQKPAPKSESNEGEEEELPKWVQATRAENAALMARVEEEARERRRLESEVSRLRDQSQPAKQEEQKPAPKPDEHAYWASMEDLKRERSEFETRLQADRVEFAKVATKQERNSFEAAINRLRKEYDSFDATMPKEKIEAVWQNFVKSPTNYGGYGQDWYTEFAKVHQALDYPRLRAEVEKRKQHDDEVAKKREEKKKKDVQNLGKVPRGGASFQENRKPRERAVRDMRALRGEAIQFLTGE